MAGSEILKTYSWLDDDLFATILNEHNHGKPVTIQQFHLQSAVDDGENYSSFLMKAIVVYSDELGNHIKNFMIKVGHGLVRSHNVFEKEIFIYKEICPKFERLLHLAHIPIKFAPKFYGGDSQQSYLIMDDLTAANYKNLNRSFGLNFDQMKLCLRTLAAWHAASVVQLMQTNSSKIYALYQKPHVCLTGTPHYRTLFENAIASCSETFVEMADFGDICRQLQQLNGIAFEKCCAAAERNENTINVLTHGDLWSNNIMFHNSNVKAAAAAEATAAVTATRTPLFLDFQMSYYGSPILDVSYFLFTSSSEHIRTYEFDRLFDYYCDQLIDMMRKLNLPSDTIPSKRQLHTEFRLRACYGGLFALFSVPLRVCNTPIDKTAIQQFLSRTEDGRTFRRQLYSNERAKKILIILLKYFDEKMLLN